MKDGNNNTNGNKSGGNTFSDSSLSKLLRRKETVSRAGNTKLKVDKVVVHEVDEYYNLPEGGRS